MVNAEKHRQKIYKTGMLPIEDVEFMNKFCKKIIDDTNENPEIQLIMSKGVFPSTFEYGLNLLLL